MIKKLKWFLLLFLILTVTNNCSRQLYKAIYPTLTDGLYDTEFPYRSCSKQLEEIVETVKLLNSIAYYKSYAFSQEAQITEFPKTDPESFAEKVIYFNNTSSGTATVIYGQDKIIALLTCAHIINFPDTVITYFEGKKTIKSISIKMRQHNYINELPEGDELKIVALDNDLDVAIVQRTLTTLPVFPITRFTYPIGAAKELEWGSFVYLLGYPKGNRMITRGIVSKPNSQKMNSDFLVDALFNRGFSGGIVIAVRDGVPNFEFVGMAKSVAADYQYILTPGSHFQSQTFDPNLPHTGEIFVEHKGEINYGITRTLSSENIVSFLAKKRFAIENAGLDPELFFK